MARKSIEIFFDATADLGGRPIGWFARENGEDIALELGDSPLVPDDGLLAALDSIDPKYARYHVELVNSDDSTEELR